MRKRKVNQNLTEYVDNPLFKNPKEAKAVVSEALCISVPPYILHLDNTHRSGPPFRLSPAQEKTLFLAYNYTKAQYRASASNGRANLSELEKTAFLLRDKLVNANLALVPGIAKKAGQILFNDATSEGYSAVQRSIEKFDVARGNKFSTYACTSINSALRRLRRKESKIAARYPVEFDPNLEGYDATQNRHNEALLFNLERLERELATNSAGLSQIERAIIAGHFGIALPGKRPNKNGKETLKELGKEAGLSPERVRQLEDQAIRKLREHLLGEEAHICSPEPRKRRKRIPIDAEPPKYSDMRKRTPCSPTPITEEQHILTSIVDGIPLPQIVREVKKYWGHNISEGDILIDFSEWTE